MTGSRMFDHVDFAVTDLDGSRSFYTAVLAPLGIGPFMEVDREDGRKSIGFGSHTGPRLWIGGGPPVGRRLHLAFAAGSRAAVDAFHRAALGVGGTSRGAPGLRPHDAENYHAAFVTDPDGHVVEAVCRRAG